MAKNNGASATIELNREEGKGESTAGIQTCPETYEVTIQGVADILFHRYDIAAVEAQKNAKKNSKEKKSDNLESYVYRCEDGTLGVPAACFRAALVNAAKSKSDPRSPRKSARDLINAVVLVTPNLASLGKNITKWDYEDTRRVLVQRNAVARTRPAMRSGWKLTYHVTILDSSYVDRVFLQDLIQSAGGFVGLCDYRPQYGRFAMVGFKKLL